MKTTVKYHQGDPWRLSEAAFDPAYLGKYEAIFTLGNGYLGTRAATEESYVGEKRDTFVAGTFDRFNEDEVTELPNLPDVFGLGITLDDNPLNLAVGEVVDYDRSLNLATGELTRRFIWEVADHRYQFESSRFVSLAKRHVLGQRIRITALDQPTQLLLTAGINGQVTNTGTQHFNDDVKRLYPGNILQLSTKTDQSQINFVITSGHSLQTEAEVGTVKTEMLRRKLISTYPVSLAVGQTITFTNLTTIYSSRDRDVTYPDIASLRELGLKRTTNLQTVGYDALLEESGQAWQDQIWRGMPIQIESTDVKDALAMNFARYHLTVMTPAHDPRMNIAAKGLSGEGYKGHTFWDTELFMLPYYIFTYPKIARSLETYRFLTLGGARRKAADNGYRGAQYPWESAWIDDGETTPVWGATDIVTGKATKIWSGFIEQHITADVAYGINEYIQATGDTDFADAMGYEVIIDTARFWASRLEYNQKLDRYEICDVIGPDEYKEHADNNAFTNHMAKWNMQLALTLISELHEHRQATYQRLDQRFDLVALAAEIQSKLSQLYLPEPNDEGVIPQDDAYLSKQTLDLSAYLKEDQVGSLFDHFNLEQVDNMQVTKQADVILLLFLFEKHFSQVIKRKNWDYYEPKTTHDSSLSLLTHSIFAADLGDQALAYQFYQRARDIDMGPNMFSSTDGIHAASIGGIWSMTIFGFGGIRYLDGRLRVSPHLPKAWTKLAFQLWWHGQKLAFEVTHQQVTIKNLTGTKSVSVDTDHGVVDVPENTAIAINLA
ncbi:glycoside hydrolase family 65 protein [Lacticaseibacillus porcinae]|uniref:glycoside hydrolase family 65 protein n=1 Tax=Lacticaseibacillus porcinae TaxID=1123687 RepID=UPI000F78C305|nr:glycosyl hydrolase family 65 protein [Lacticaseibacillus porcinae]